MPHVTIPDIPQRRSYVANGIETQFAVPFPFFSYAEIQVFLNGTKMMGGYIVGGQPEEDGYSSGGVLLSAAPPAGTVVVVLREVSVSRETDFPYPAQILDIRALNRDLDRAVAFGQDQRAHILRSLRAPIWEPPIAEMPNRAARANNLLMFDGAGDPLVISPGAFTSSGTVPGEGSAIYAHEFLTPGMSDHAQAVQSAIDRAFLQGGGLVILRAGYWNLASTILLRNQVSLRGEGKATTILRRTGAYGDTIRQVGGTCSISDMWLWHGNGSPYSLEMGVPIPDCLTDGSAQIRLTNCQEVNLERLRLFRMPYGVVFDGTVHSRLRDVWTFGLWNPDDETQREGLADVLYMGTSQRCQLGVIEGCYFSGVPGNNLPSPFTFLDGTGGSATASVYRNTGRLISIDVAACEGLAISNTYVGRASSVLVNLEPRGAQALVADVMLSNVFFDDVGVPVLGAQLRICGNPDAYVLGLNVSGCTFNGEYDAVHGIFAQPPYQGSGTYPNVCGMTVTGCTFFAHVAASMRLHAVRGANISGNTFSNYNCLGVTPIGGNLTYASAVFIGNQCQNVYLSGNTIGGGGNSFEPLFGNNCHYGITIDPDAAPTCSQFGNVDAGVTTAFAAQQVSGPLLPKVDNAYLLGSGPFRFAGVYSANGVIQTSGEDDKLDIEPLPDTGPFIDAVGAITYRMKVGGITVNPDGTQVVREGVRTHWGFPAGAVKAAALATGRDCGAYVLTAEGKEMLRYDELLPVVWEEVRRLRARIAGLEGN